ncbi:hypothetical protein, partial [Listeria innocua]|uniref:hypothetical protein n=1 Tax=Listeria innocua TaxID=1642 RepID=UPI001C8B2E03
YKEMAKIIFGPFLNHPVAPFSVAFNTKMNAGGIFVCFPMKNVMVQKLKPTKKVPLHIFKFM